MGGKVLHLCAGVDALLLAALQPLRQSCNSELESWLRYKPVCCFPAAENLEGSERE